MWIKAMSGEVVDISGGYLEIKKNVKDATFRLEATACSGTMACELMSGTLTECQEIRHQIFKSLGAGKFDVIAAVREMKKNGTTK